MIRKTLIALTATVAIGSTAFAAQIDGDANPVPGQNVLVNQVAGLDNVYASTRRGAQTLSIEEKMFLDRPSQVH